MEVFVNLIFQNFSKECYFRIRNCEIFTEVAFKIKFDRIYNCSCPFYNQTLQTVFLNQIGVHELFHGFVWLAKFSRFLIKLNFLRVYIINYFLQLARRQNLLPYSRANLSVNILILHTSLLKLISTLWARLFCVIIILEVLRRIF